MRIFEALSADEELEIWHTGRDVEPRLEIGEAFDTPFPMGGSRLVHAISPERGSLFGIYGVERLQQLASEIAAGPGQPADEVFAALCFAAASDEFDADGFVTERDYLIHRQDPRAPVAFRAREALGLIGLVRRAHGNDSLGNDTGNMRLLGSTYHFVLERELLRGGWRWFSGAVSSGLANGDDSILYLAQTGRERFTRVLQIRERLHTAAKGEPTRARGDEIVFQLETLLMFLSASFDAAARVAHAVYFGSNYSGAGWRKERWRERMRDEAPDLAALADDGSRGGSLLQIIGALRNTIHGEGLRAGELSQAGQPTVQLVRLTERDGQRIKGLIEGMGEDPANWGLHETQTDLRLAADRFVEALLPESTSLLNKLMSETDTMRLPGASPESQAQPIDQPSADGWQDMLSFEVRSRVRLLGGL